MPPTSTPMASSEASLTRCTPLTTDLGSRLKSYKLAPRSICCRSTCLSKPPTSKPAIARAGRGKGRRRGKGAVVRQEVYGEKRTAGSDAARNGTSRGARARARAASGDLAWRRRQQQWQRQRPAAGAEGRRAGQLPSPAQMPLGRWGRWRRWRGGARTSAVLRDIHATDTVGPLHLDAHAARPEVEDRDELVAADGELRVVREGHAPLGGGHVEHQQRLAVDSHIGAEHVVIVPVHLRGWGRERSAQGPSRGQSSRRSSVDRQRARRGRAGGGQQAGRRRPKIPARALGAWLRLCQRTWYTSVAYDVPTAR